MPNLISSSQSAFVKWRLIIDNVLVYFELMQYLKQKRQDKKILYVFKTGHEQNLWFIGVKLFGKGNDSYMHELKTNQADYELC